MFRKSTKPKIESPLEVCLIGCGPAGMSFLHALNEKKKNPKPKYPLPIVTCYEWAPGPGGIWRDVPDYDKNRNDDENKVLAYDDMWTNTPKELMEFYDYTFDDHFKKETPTFLPRKDILEYLIARNGADGALDDVHYGHYVEKVKFDEKKTKFTVTVVDEKTDKKTSKEFDRIVFGGGYHVEPDAPSEITEVLKEFKGKVLHSSEATENFGEEVEGKTVIMIGDSSSAEDLALRAIKLGVKKIYVTARRGFGDCAETGCWPEDKVEVVYSVPFKVVKEKSFKCQPMYWSEKRQRWRRDSEEEVTKIKDVDLVILCTGYDYDFEMFPSEYQLDLEETWEVPKNWFMDNNALTISVGNVVPNKKLWLGAAVWPGCYNGALIKNTNIFYLIPKNDSYSPLLDLDVLAWLILSYLSGENSLPSEKEMVKQNQKDLETEIQIPYIRMAMDYEYFAEIDELDENHWSQNAADERSIKLERQDKDYKARRLAREMKLAKYPVEFGDYKKLSKMGEKYVDMCIATDRSRSSLVDSSGSDWRTFRDIEAPKYFASLYTSTPSCPLPKPWLQLQKDPEAPAKLENYS